jgi:hypothetical protein
VIELVEWLDGCQFQEAVETLTHEPKPNGQAGPQQHSAPKPGAKPHFSITATFPYLDENLKLLFQTVRWEAPNEEKNYSQRRPDGKGGWINDLKGVRLIPFMLPELLEDLKAKKVIAIVEGEKCVLECRRHGIAATCNPMGAGKWLDAFSKLFKGHDVIVCADNDEPGRKHVEKVAQSLLGIAARIRVLDLAKYYALEEREDIYDWFKSGNVAADFWELIDQLPDFGKNAPYGFPDESTIPARAWVYAMHYIAGFVCATVAPGGFGKTTLALNEALNMAMQGSRVWYISGEDDMEELDRRIAAHCKRHKLKRVDFGNRFFVDDKNSFPLKIAKANGKGAPTFDEARLKEFEHRIKIDEIDIIILDPLVSFHLLNESDTSAMDAMVKRLGVICTHTHCGIELAHHVRKPDSRQAEITVYDARGAGAIINAVRSCRVLNLMSEAEAQQLKPPPEKPSTYLRIDNGKRNMAPAEKARWMHIISVPLLNGDDVQALEPFEFKPQETTDADEAWVVAELSARKDYRADSRSPDWFGIAIASHFNRGYESKGDVIWINKQIKKWLLPDVKKGSDGKPRRPQPLIRKIQREDEHRHLKQFFELVESVETSHIWRSKDYDFPCTPTGREDRAPDGRIFVEVRTPDGNQSFIPKDELVAKGEPDLPPFEPAYRRVKREKRPQKKLL